MENTLTLKRNHGYGLARAAIWPAILRCLVATGVGLVSCSLQSAEMGTNKPAVVKVSGFGFLGNREMVRLLRGFRTDQTRGGVVDRTFIEDSVLVLFSRAESQGYLSARLRASFTMSDGSRKRLEWTNALAIQLPRDFEARKTQFSMRCGVRSYYKSVEIQGVTAISQREARSYFVSGDTLISPHRNRAFSPDLLKNSLAALREVLVRKGLSDATVLVSEIHWNEKNGGVTLKVGVHEGLPTIVRSVLVDVIETETQSTNRYTLRPGKPYSYLWQQDFARQLQEQQFPHGRPDASVDFSTVRVETNAAVIQIDLAARVLVGPLVHLGEVIFSGNERTRESVLRSRVKLKEGSLLNRLEVEKSRQSLARLGVFDSVGLQHKQTNATTRDVVYELKETKPMSLSLLGGYGSYEMLRGGMEYEHRNVFGLAHDVRLRGSQSFKSTRGELQYTVPELLGENVNVFLKGSGLRREEVSFTREEVGGSIGLQKRLTPIRTDLAAHYDYEFLNAQDVSAVSTNEELGVQQARAATFNIELNHDRRDNPLLPSRGLKLFSKFEVASTVLGGEVDYQRIMLSASYHVDLRGGRLLHMGVVHGVTFTLGGEPTELPFNKRFFPGGEDSVRGYQDGEACPVDANGNQLGAETYTQGNFEFEQLITKSWSLVAFFDAVGFAVDRANYPWDEGLYSIGGGIRWRTLIGPVRVEYGHNLNPRAHDPSGTLHFSIGFPF